ncbi:hypothetical protein J1N09_05145 [Aureitalea sp. L0-47]|uniref:hypothetical protein n=1 Tax=Aureitalea sp. L0-47 TaxID=2816962 RepID=UPI002237DA56|nr:hypothetical protein [Aureitalea sp. L0-47]MCW5519213.1 hypothetical protein [Aureitalea sp. L0-47]
MKRIALLIATVLLFSCSESDESITQVQVELSVSHYKTTDPFNGTAFIINEDGDPTPKRAQIDNFFFEPGFNYQLTANKVTTENAGTNSGSVRYRAVTVNSREAVRPDIEFRIPLIQFVNGSGLATFIRRQADSTFILSNEIQFNCNYFCVELDQAIEQQYAVEGSFSHGPDGTYVLQALAN